MDPWPAYAAMAAVVLLAMGLAAIPAIVVAVRRKRLVTQRGFEVITKPEQNVPGARKD